jgi:very-short-patch-repair endonuclease
MTWYVLFFVVLAAIVVFRLWLQQSESSSVQHSDLSYKRKLYFFTRSENEFFGLLQRTLKGRNVVIFPKVRVADVLESTSGVLAGFNRISQKHIDYLVVSLPDFQPVMAIELDDKSHGSQKQQARDAVKDQAFNSAGLPLVRVPVSRDLSDVMLLSMLEPHLKSVLSNAQKAVSRG